MQNRIGGVHATVMALIAETASGFVLVMNLPDDKRPGYRYRVSTRRRPVARWYFTFGYPSAITE